MTIRTEKAYAAHCTQGIPYDFIHVNSVSDRAYQARAYVGEAWAHDGEGVRRGWKRAFKAGWRVIRVQVSAA